MLIEEILVFWDIGVSDSNDGWRVRFEQDIKRVAEIKRMPIMETLHIKKPQKCRLPFSLVLYLYFESYNRFINI